MPLDAYSNRCAIKTILLSQLLVEQLDELKDTTLFNRAVKNLSNKLEAILHPLCRKYYDKMYSADVQNSIDVLDAVIEQVVHSTIVDAEPLEIYNLYVLKDANGKTTKIKSNLPVKEFEKKYNIKLTNLISKNYEYDEFNTRVETLKKSIEKGNIKFSPEFMLKLAEIKQRVEQNMNKNVTPVITIDNFKKLSKEDRTKVKRVIKLNLSSDE